MNYDDRYRRYQDLTEGALEEYLPAETAFPPLIHQAMRYSVVGGGKRIRPVLALATTETLGGDPIEVLPAACALEMIHAYSLIHDDLPAMDNDDFRRGKPSNHKAYGEAVAILAGDALLTHAFYSLAQLKNREPGVVLQVIQEIAHAAGTCGMIGGQVVDTCPAESTTPTQSPTQSQPNAQKAPQERATKETLDYIHRHKTGALYRASVRSGAILSGADNKSLAALTDYAENLGLLFQVVDDILDIEGDQEKLGKPIGSDLKNQKITYPLLYGITESKKQVTILAEQALTALTPFGPEADFLRTLIHRMANRDR